MTECYELQLNDQCSMVIYNYTYNVNYTSFGDCYIFENTDQICDIEDISNNDAQYTQVETYLISNQFECDSYPNGMCNLHVASMTDLVYRSHNAPPQEGTFLRYTGDANSLEINLRPFLFVFMCFLWVYRLEG